MKFIADEGIDLQIVKVLLELGHQVVYIAHEFSGASDEYILNMASETESILITRDKDFGELIFKENRLHQGVILLRIPELSSVEKAILVSKLIQKHEDELRNCFTVLSTEKVRIRKI